MDRSKKKDQGRYCMCKKSKNTYIECTPETELSNQHKRSIQSKTEKC